MQSKFFIRGLVACIATLLSVSLFAQTTSTKNTYSLYSMYGIGDMATPGTLPMRSMGGAGVASRDGTSMNLLNPASYSLALRQGILIDMSFDGSLITNAQKDYSGDTNYSGFLAGAIHNISLQFPLAKGIGMGFSLAPYSTVGYYLNTNEINSDYQYINYNYQGNGDITEIKLGVGIKVAKGLSLGVAGQYYWGLLDRYFSLSVMQFTSVHSYSTAQGLTGLYVSKLKAQFGAQWEAVSTQKRMLTFGLTYDIGGSVSPEMDVIATTGSATDLVEIISRDEYAYPALSIPQQIVFGATYRDKKWAASADYTYQNWGDNETTVTTYGTVMSYTNVHLVKMGIEYTPNRLDARRYLKRASYRAGLRVGNYYQSYAGEILPQWAVTAGMGLPIDLFGMSSVDVGMEFGGLGSTKSVGSGSSTMNLVRQNYFKISFGISLFGDDYWFHRFKYD